VVAEKARKINKYFINVRYDDTLVPLYRLLLYFNRQAAVAFR
jgi:hypothetical protein